MADRYLRDLARMKAVVFGSGSIGRRHIASLRHLVPDCEITLVRRDAYKDDFSHQIGANVLATSEEALATAPDLAVIATPSAMHNDALVPCIHANLPIYIEKPAVTKEDHVTVLAELMTSTGFSAPTQVGCNLRFLPAIQRTHQMIASGRLGNVVRASLQAGQYLPDWRPGTDYRSSYSADTNRGGGVLFDLIHEIDMAEYLMGPFADVSAFTADVASLGVKSEAVATCILRAEAGLPLVMVGLDYQSRAPIRKYDVIGESGTLQLDLVKKEMRFQTTGSEDLIWEDPSEFDTAQTYIAAMAELLEAIETGTPTRQDLHAGLRSAALAMRIKRIS